MCLCASKIGLSAWYMLGAACVLCICVYVCFVWVLRVNLYLIRGPSVSVYACKMLRVLSQKVAVITEATEAVICIYRWRLTSLMFLI